MICRDCKYCMIGEYRIKGKPYQTGCCILTRIVVHPDIDFEKCNCYNRDLSEYDICYNCKYYLGGSDWGLFCSHKDKYHHLGKFSDKPCEYYDRRIISD